jgi:pimeloyl-ACP methyl ester carboxylesterase
LRLNLHYVSAGDSGSPILLVHGWPETWWAFRKLIPLLAPTHRVFALDLRGFGDSSSTDAEYGEAVAAEDLHHLVEHIGPGPVHLLCQDLSGGTGFRFAPTHPADVVSFIAVETTLAGFGLEALADVNGFGSWHVGFLGAPGIPAMLLPGHERELLTGWAYPLMTGTHDAVTDGGMDEFVRTYARPNAWRGTEGLYQALFSDHGATKALAEAHRSQSQCSQSTAPHRQLSSGKGSDGGPTRPLADAGLPATESVLAEPHERLARPPVLTHGQVSTTQRHPCGAGQSGT